jgi:hypothetical protein
LQSPRSSYEFAFAGAGPIDAQRHGLIQEQRYKIAAKKVVVVPEEAEKVRLIFARYLELGSLAALIEDLDRRDIRTKVRALAGGKRRGGIRFGRGTPAASTEKPVLHWRNCFAAG